MARKTIKSVGLQRLNALSPLLQYHQESQKQRVEQHRAAMVQSILPVYPNPGSQADLMFRVLGVKKGDDARTLTSSPEVTERITAILEKEKLEVVYPETLNHTITQYPLDLSTGLNPQARAILYRAGNGAGKSTMGAVLCYLMSAIYPNAVGLISANTYDQLRDSTLVSLIQFLLAHNIPFSPWKGDVQATVRSIESRKGISINGCWHFVRSADSFAGGESSPQSGRGLEVSHVWGDEWLRVPNDQAFNTVLTRTRIPGVPSIILLTSTINTDNPYNWGWQKFDDPDRSDVAKKKFISITGSSIENRHNLADTYVEDMYAAMSPELFRIEVLGEYAGLTTGKLIKYFSRDLHVFPDLAVQPGFPLYLSIDFNWNPSTAIAAQYVEGEIRIIREWFLSDSNTFELSNHIEKWVSQYPNHLIVTGDASGGQRTANSQQTNWQIIRNSLRNRQVSWVYGKSNPSIQDTVNAINSALFHDRLIVSTDCKELLKDIESASYPYEKFKKKNSDRSHWFDELRYLVHHIMPYRPKEQPLDHRKPTGIIV